MQAEILFLLSAFTLAVFVRVTNGIDEHDDLMRKAKVTYETRKNNLRQCYCVPVNYPGMTVPEFLSPYDNHNRRLVVYLYKDENNHLNAYVPNQEKQIALPDFTLDKGERLEKLSNSAIKDLFETSPSVEIPVPNENIIAHPNIAENVPGYSYIPYGISGHVEAPLKNNGMIDLKDPDLSSITTQGLLQFPNGGDAINGYIDNIELPGITNLLETSRGLLNPDKTNLDTFSQPPGTIEIMEPQLNPFVEDPSVFIETPTKHSDSLVIPGTANILSPEVSHLGEYGQVPIIETDSNLLYPSQEEYNYDLSSNKNPNKNQYFLSKHHMNNVLNNAQLKPGSLEIVDQVSDMSPFFVKPHGNFVYDVDPSGVEGELLDSGHQSSLQVPNKPVISPLTGNNLGSYFVEHSHPGEYNRLGLPYNQPNKDFFLTQNILNGYPDYPKWIVPHGERPAKHAFSHITFDEWLLSQVRLLQVHKPFMYHSINKNSLKMLIEKTLRESGISVSSSGVLIDPNGQPVRMDNLQLRPVLLGDPALFRKLMESNKCIIPHNIPYLEAVLVTLSYPPQILGIINLGQADLIEPNTITHRCNSGSCTQKVSCSSGQCNLLKKTPTRGLLGSFTRRANIEEDKDASMQDLTLDSENSLFEDLESNPDQTTENVNVSDKTISHENESDSTNEIQTSVNDVDDSDGLGIRIIGGQPATASGVPLASKGRR